MEANDDFFGDQEDDSVVDTPDEKNKVDSESTLHQSGGLAEREMRFTQEQFRNMGYLEAYDETKEERLQEGFEAGYKDFFEAAMIMGEALGEATSPLWQDDLLTLSEDDDNVKRVVQSVRSFLTQVDKEEEDSEAMQESIDKLTEQLQELLLKKP